MQATLVHNPSAGSGRLTAEQILELIRASQRKLDVGIASNPFEERRFLESVGVGALADVAPVRASECVGYRRRRSARSSSWRAGDELGRGGWEAFEIFSESGDEPDKLDIRNWHQPIILGERESVGLVRAMHTSVAAA